MATGQWAVVLRHVQRLFQGECVSGLSEAQLLERFASTRDEVAFGAILARHGPMVLGVCRGVLDDPNDVEDAFQATFLVLVKKAGALRDADRLAQWLYGVARRVSLRARSDSTRRKARERPDVEETIDPHATLDADLRELQTLIREEVDRLSSNDRMAVVLCYLEGLTHEEAADRLGWPVGTVKGRLSRARDKLRVRLTRRGVALPTAILTSSLVEAASTAVPPALLRSTTLAAIQLASGKNLAAGIVSAQAITLMEGVIGTMFTTKLKIAAAALVATCGVAVPGVLAFQGQSPAVEADKSQSGTFKKSTEFAPKGRAIFSNSGEPAKDARREELARLAEQALKLLDENVAQRVGSPPSNEVYIWSRRLVEAKAGPNSPEADRKTILQAHRDRMEKQFLQVSQSLKAGMVPQLSVLEAQFRLAEAERWLRDGSVGDVADEKPEFVFGRGPGGFPNGSAGLLAGGRPGGGRLANFDENPADAKRDQVILAKLDEAISMNFPTATPLEDIKKYIQDATQDEAAGLPTGVPIYIAPEGLESAEAKLESTIKINLEGVPLRTTLRLALRQLGLDYRVAGGVVLISDVGEITMQNMRASRVGPAK